MLPMGRTTTGAVTVRTDESQICGENSLLDDAMEMRGRRLVLPVVAPISDTCAVWPSDDDSWTLDTDQDATSLADNVTVVTSEDNVGGYRYENVTT